METNDRSRPLNSRRSVTYCSIVITCACACLALATSCTRVSTQIGSRAGAANPWTHQGVLRIGDTRVPDNLNRMLGTLTVDTELGSLWCARLFLVDDNEALQPELALVEPTLQNRGISQDGKTIVYHLRPNVRWQDGAPFTSADVAFSWRQVMNPNNVVQSQDFYNTVHSIEAPDPQTVVVHLRTSQAGFVQTFFTDYCMVPQHLLGSSASLNHVEYNRLPIGTGPFRVVENQPGVFIRFIANPDYWRGPPKLKEIDYHFVTDATTLLTQMRTHELDFFHDVPAEQAQQLGMIEGTQVFRYPFSRFADIGFNEGRVPLSDLRVRQALAYGTNVPALIQVAAHGEYIQADGDQPPWRWSYNDSAQKYPYDPRRAAALLDAAGWRVGANGLRYHDGQPLELSMVGQVDDATTVRSETVLQQQWRTLGIDVSIRNFPSNILYALGSGVEQSGKFDVSFEGWSETVDPDNIQLFGCHMAPPNGWNIYHFCDPAIERAEVTARGSFDSTARKQAYAQIEDEVQAGLPFYVLWFVRDEDLANSDLRGYRPGRTLSAFWNVWEWSI